MTAALKALGNWKLQVNTGSDGTPTWVDVPEVRSASGGGTNTDRIDVTNFSSTGNSREYIGGLSDPQARSFTMNYIPGNAAQVAMRTANASGAAMGFRIELAMAAGSGAENGTFHALVTKYGDPEGDPAKELTISFELTPTGATTWGAPS